MAYKIFRDYRGTYGKYGPLDARVYTLTAEFLDKLSYLIGDVSIEQDSMSQSGSTSVTTVFTKTGYKEEDSFKKLKLE